MIILTGDIGGTNTRLRLTEIKHNERINLAEQDYQSQSYSALSEIINIFSSEVKSKQAIDAVCMAVAGPVKSGVATITNLPWLISKADLGRLLNTDNICLINDFIAVSYGISQLKDADFLLIQQGGLSTEEHEPSDAAVIGAGTGLGASHLIWKQNHYEACASEAGHAGFAPETAQQTQLLSWMQKSGGHVSLEHLLSGRGFLTIYQFLLQSTEIEESSEVREAMQVDDPAKIITQYALSQSDQLCQMTLDLFIEIYGASASNIALHYYPLKTVYIAGGIAVIIKDSLNSERFINAFTNKGLMSENMKALSIRLVLDDRVGLYGALEHVIRVFGTHRALT